MTWTPAILAVAPNGARRGRDDHPDIPLTPAELALEAAICREAGAAMIHLHVRDAEGRHSLDAELYRAAINAIRKAVGNDLIIQATSEAADSYTPARQRAAIRALLPEAVSVSVRELASNDTDEAEFAALLTWMAAERIAPQFILYDVDDIVRFRGLHRRGMVPFERPFVLLVLGRYSAGGQSEPSSLLPLLTALGDFACDWAVCAFGAREAACAAAALSLGGHARVGFENNLLLADGSQAPNNGALVRQAADASRAIGRTIADAAKARALLGMTGGR